MFFLYHCNNSKVFIIWITLKFDDRVKIERLCERLSYEEVKADKFKTLPPWFISQGSSVYTILSGQHGS